MAWGGNAKIAHRTGAASFLLAGVLDVDLLAARPPAAVGHVPPPAIEFEPGSCPLFAVLTLA